MKKRGFKEGFSEKKESKEKDGQPKLVRFELTEEQKIIKTENNNNKVNDNLS